MLEVENVVPNCRLHHHLSRQEADDVLSDSLVMFDDQGKFQRIQQARWVGKGKRFMTYERGRTWRKVPSGPFNVACMQLVPGGGSW